MHRQCPGLGKEGKAAPEEAVLSVRIFLLGTILFHEMDSAMRRSFAITTSLEDSLMDRTILWLGPRVYKPPCFDYRDDNI